MHYKNGRPAQNGDKVVLIPTYGPPVAGILYDAKPGNDMCNGRIAITTQSDAYPDLRNVLRADDVAATPYSEIVPVPTAPELVQHTSDSAPQPADKVVRAEAVPPAPPVDNAHVAKDCEQFAVPTSPLATS